jgi:hypothetical protein
VLLKYEADIEATMPQVSTFIAKPRGERLRVTPNAREPASASFVRRGVGVRLVAESIDAMRAVSEVGIADRAILRIRFC